ncbi:uncharacterized protein VTP21DRAFT_11156 [Calcarisporiella thermophila]|uniref:uncharacterized protein n=1 Tax=Calcarisporiella thermophila TaxID=911321 RepID=UPI0037424A2E
MEEEELQSNEILALQSIYPQQFAVVKIPSENTTLPRYSGTITVDVLLPSEIAITFLTNSNDPSPDQEKLMVGYLPPVTVRFSLPHGYPSKKPPEIKLECVWLSEDQLALLYKRLMKSWEGEHSEVLFDMVDFIQNRTFDFLGLGSSITIADTGATLYDLLRTFNFISHQSVFENETFTCGICMDFKKGIDCVRLAPCGHVYCRTCIQGYFTMLIREGMVTSVKCPDCPKEDKKEIATDQLRDIVGAEMEDRYTRLVHKQRLEADPTVSFCPRIECQAPVFPDTDQEKLGYCTKCGFAFCRMCQRVWHGTSEYCRMPNSTKIVQEYMSGNEETKRRLEYRYGRSNLLRLVEDIENQKATEDWISNNTSQCPSCGLNIEKSYGCNHMTCSRCQTHFCYLCGHHISTKLANPYLHFSDPSSPCHMRLFENLMEMEDDDPLIFFD